MTKHIFDPRAIANAAAAAAKAGDGVLGGLLFALASTREAQDLARLQGRDGGLRLALAAAAEALDPFEE